MAVSYSTVVTWSYFGAYTILFGIVSIWCAISVVETQKETLKGAKISEMSKKKIFSKWWSLLFKKKKVYLQLIPHFFDQATDLGTILEYYSFRNNDKILETINTLYLFYISIFIIIFHKIISSLAIYHLTKKKSFFFYQLFDVLLVRCVWINYKLNIDEPSNAQRYLQVLEAILESAPQLLVSSAFIIKTDTYSPIILLSLITSFWTLTSRVVADDKQMVSNEWKNFDFLKEYKLTKLFNYKYLVRVICWRFLEISSRITLICLIWINLGGFAVIIIIWLELIYLSIICYGCKSFGMLCNIIYLTASSSTTTTSDQDDDNNNNKDIPWAISMAKLFWAYRILSSWLFLILITILATTEFNAWKIDDYTTRNELTFNQNIGLFFYIFTWIAMPIWQWVCFIIVFDYKNLQSVSRDVTQLCQQNQWKDVIELLSFGAYNIDYEYLFIQSTKQMQFHNGYKRLENPMDALRMNTMSNVESKTINNDDLFPKQIASACLKHFYYINEIQNVYFRSIYHGFKDNVVFIIEQGFDINTIDNKGRTGLFYAAASNNYDMVRILVKGVKGRKIDCNILDENGYNALHFAVIKCKIQSNILKCLTEEGHCDTCSCSKDNDESILDTSRKTQSKDIIKQLISYGASFDFSDNDNEYFLGCYQGFITVIEKALNDENNIINVNITDKTNKNRSGLHYALISTSSTKKEVIEYLIETVNIDVNIKDDQGYTPLHLAIIALPSFDKGILKYLLETNKCDINSFDNNQLTIIDAAIFKKNSIYIDILIEYGAKLNIDKYSQDELIAFYFTMCFDGCLNVIKYLISNEIVDINCIDINGRNGLHYACFRNNIALIKCLIDLNIDVNHKDKWGFSPFHLIMYLKKGTVFRSPFKKELIPLLIEEAKCDINSVDDNGNSIIQTAKRKQPHTIVDLLKKHNAEISDNESYKPHQSKIEQIRRQSINLIPEYMNSDNLLDTKHLNIFEEEPEIKEEIIEAKESKTDASEIITSEQEEENVTNEAEIVTAGQEEEEGEKELENDIEIEMQNLLNGGCEWRSKKKLYRTISSEPDDNENKDVEWMITELDDLDVSFFGIGVGFCSFLLVFTFFYGIHIVALIINNIDLCPITDDNATLLYDYNDHINYGCSIYLGLMTLTIIMGLLYFLELFEKCHEKCQIIFESAIVRGVLFMLVLLFSMWLFSWCVIGFLVHSNMKKQSNDDIEICKDIVLTVSIFELLQSIILGSYVIWVFIQLKYEFEWYRASKDESYALDKEKNTSKKIILLGSGFVGKTTMFRQIERVFGDGFDGEYDYRRMMIDLIKMQLLGSMRDMVYYGAEYLDKGEFRWTSIEAEQAAKTIEEAGYSYDIPLNEEIVSCIETLWNEPDIQDLFESDKRFKKDSSAYFWDNVQRIADEDYVPTDQDILYYSFRTTGINTSSYDIAGNKFEFIDTGGQRCERRKWIHCFEDVDCMIFVTSLSNYNEVLFEDHKANAMQDQIELWGRTVNLDWFEKCEIILFLNKYDLFRIKIQDVPLSVCFDDYEEYKTNSDDLDLELNENQDDYEYELALGFIKNKYLSLVENDRKVYTHITCIIDSEPFHNLLNDIQRQVILSGFKATRLKSMKTMKSLRTLDLDLV